MYTISRQGSFSLSMGMWSNVIASARGKAEEQGVKQYSAVPSGSGPELLFSRSFCEPEHTSETKEIDNSSHYYDIKLPVLFT